MRNETVVGILMLLGYIADRPRVCKAFLVRKYYHAKWRYLEKFHGK